MVRRPHEFYAARCISGNFVPRQVATIIGEQCETSQAKPRNPHRKASVIDWDAALVA
jgi:hypothetical protein